MAQKYLLQWLDTTVTETFDPEKATDELLTPEKMQYLAQKVNREVYKVKTGITDQVFRLKKEKQTRLYVAKYHEALIVLLGHLLEHQKAPVFMETHIQTASAAFIASLDELLTFLEARFSGFLSLTEEVASNYLKVSKMELKKKLAILREPLKGYIGVKNLTGIVLGNLTTFVDSQRNKHVTLREVLYRKELITELDELIRSKKEGSPSEALNELLIYMNYNSTAYMNLYTGWVAEQINSEETLRQRLEKLQACARNFGKLYSNKNIALYPTRESLKTILNRWFNGQITALTEKKTQIVQPLNARDKAVATALPDESFKVLWALSADQIALLLRAADETRLIKAKSLNAVFNGIIPFISTPNKKDLSPSATRSQAYNPEEQDKQLVIEILQKMIRKIEGY